MLTVIEKVLLLQDLDFFRLAETEHLAQLAENCNGVDLSRGTLLFRRGDRSDPLFLLVYGRLSLDDGAGRSREVSRGVIELISFFSEGARETTGRAVADSRLLTVSFEAMADLCSTEPQFCWAVARELARRSQTPQREVE